ncbi:MAG: hypothetical protein IPF82_00015 [Blastocatellia bacterium]|nr:hypothetical protein [Blastocatellia bacterium]
MVDFEQFQDKFSDSGQRVMKRAYDRSGSETTAESRRSTSSWRSPNSAQLLQQRRLITGLNVDRKPYHRRSKVD